VASGVNADTAHDMPGDVRVQLFLAPSGSEMRVLVRLPLISLLNTNLPKRGEEFLDLATAGPGLQDAAGAAARALEIYEGDVQLRTPRIADVRVSLPSDRSFSSYELALAHVQAPALPIDTDVVWNQGFFDALLVYDLESAGSRLGVHPHFASLAPRVVTALSGRLPSGEVRAFELNNDPGLVRLDPRWFESASRFARAGFLHSLGGMDYLLFLVCLVIPVRRLRELVPVVAAFTVAYSATLVGSAYQIAPTGSWFQPAIGALIALSVAYAALDNILFSQDLRHRWVIAFGFGLAHGFGSSVALERTLQFAGNHYLTSVVSFDAGVEMAQLVALAAVIPVLAIVFRYAASERIAIVVLSALICHAVWQGMAERMTLLTTIAWSVSDRIELARWVAGSAFAAAAGVILFGFCLRLFDADRMEGARFDAVAHETSRR
jgi:hypothetical protein